MVCTPGEVSARMPYVVDAGQVASFGVVVFALTLPGLVVLLVAVAFADHVLLRVCGHGLVPWRRDTPVSSTGFDLLHAALSPGKQDELDQRRTEELVRDAEHEGAPPRSRVDLDAGVAYLRVTE